MIDLGDVVTLPFQTQAGGSLVDATTVQLLVGLPDGTTVTITPTRTSVGTYSASYTPVQAGRHDVRWVATGPGARTHVDVLNVAPARSVSLVSLAEFKAHLNLDDTAEDEEIRYFLEAATGVVERHVGQVVARRSVTETHRLGWQSDVRRRHGLVLRQGPAISLTAISTNGGTVLNPAGYVVDTVSGEVRSTVGGGVSGLSGDVTVTYVAGYAATPPHMILAAQIIAEHLWQTQRVQTVGRGPGFGGEVVTPSGMGYAIPNRALELLGGRPPAIA